MTRQSLIALVSGFALFGLVASTASAQAPASTPSPPPSASPSAPADNAAPSAKSAPDLKADVKTGSRETTVQSRSTDADRGDSPSALPRAAAERTTIFGLNPTAAIVIGGALLLIVILAIVAMGRGTSTTTYIDPDRDRRL